MEFITIWAKQIIIAVIIGTIIEMILPNGNSKKYIKIIIGIFIVFNIISPVITKVSGKDLKLDDFVDFDKYVKESSTKTIDSNQFEIKNNSDVKQVYILNLKKDLKSKIEALGYIVNSIQIDVEDNSEYTIKQIDLIVHKKDKEQVDENNNSIVNNIENVCIQVKINSDSNTNNKNSVNQYKNSSNQNDILQISKEDESKIIDYINLTYEVSKNKIFINE